MNIGLRNIRESLRTSLWLVPTLLAIGAGALAILAVQFDRSLGSTLDGAWFLFTGGAEGARLLLSTIAGSMITVAGVTFSITVVSLSLASQQFGPRLLRNFMTDRGNQIVLGTFISTFIYSLLILRTIRGDADTPAFIPQIAVTGGVVLAIASLAVFIYFIHHVSRAIQANEVIARVAADFRSAIGPIVDDHAGSPQPEELAIAQPHGEPASIAAEADGYVQAIDHASLLSLMSEHGAMVRLTVRPGAFVHSGMTIGELWPADSLDDHLARVVRKSIHLGNSPNLTQDISFSFLQLAELGVRAMSPGINDPFTAAVCADRLGAALVHISRCGMPPSRFDDDDGQLRVMTAIPTFDDLAAASFDQLRLYSKRDPVLLARILEVQLRTRDLVRAERHRDVMTRHIAMTLDALMKASDEHPAYYATRYGRLIEQARAVTTV